MDDRTGNLAVTEPTMGRRDGDCVPDSAAKRIDRQGDIRAGTTSMI